MRTHGACAPQARLGFLDAGRAAAALAVLFEHVLSLQFPSYAHFSLHTFNFGVFGVLLFFLISGYIIPVSLERSGSLKRFWVGRVFRLFPLYLSVLAAALLLWKTRLFHLSPAFVARMPVSILVNLTMLQEMVRIPHALALFWTLSYEMLFYVLCSALFLLGLNRRTLLICWTGVVLLASINLLAPLLLGQPVFKIAPFWMLTFFIGTLYYRFTRGLLSSRALVGLLLSLFVMQAAGAYLNFVWYRKPSAPGAIAPLAYLSAWLAAYLCFSGLMMAQAKGFPSWLRRLGEASYSIYLLQGLLLVVPLYSGWRWLNVIGLSALCLSAAFVSYRLIEKPGIALGRWILASPPGKAPPTAAQQDRAA